MIAAAKVSKLVGGVPPSKLNLRERRQKKKIEISRQLHTQRNIIREKSGLVFKFVLVLTVLQTAASPARQRPQ